MMNQNTPEWHELRRKMIGASDAPIIMGVSKWRSPYALWKEKSNLGGPQPDNPVMRHGREMEPVILDHACKHLEMLFTPQVSLSKHHPWMMASLDGLSNCGKIGLEIKCAGRADHQIASENRIPKHYWPQLQHQLICAELDEVIYYSFNDGDARVVRVHRDEAYCNKLISEEQEFVRRIQDFDPPELDEKDYTERLDQEWNTAAKELVSLRCTIKELESQEKHLRETLIRMSNGQNCKGDGIRFFSSVVRGAVKYAEIPELRNVQLDDYRKPNSLRWTIK